MPLLILNSNVSEPKDYVVRKVVKAVIVNNKNEVLLFGSSLVGGGVEEGENDEDAFHREALEEIGAQIEIIKPIGEIIQYRDFLKKKYIINGYLCKYIKDIDISIASQRNERKILVKWENLQDTILKLESEIEALKISSQNISKDDIYQSKLYNRETAVCFLKEYGKFI